MLGNSNKLEDTVVKFYRVISRLNCLSKVYEMVVAEMLAN